MTFSTTKTNTLNIIENLQSISKEVITMSLNLSELVSELNILDITVVIRRRGSVLVLNCSSLKLGEILSISRKAKYSFIDETPEITLRVRKFYRLVIQLCSSSKLPNCWNYKTGIIFV